MLIYLHGLNGSSQSFKAGLLRERLAPQPVQAVDYPAHHPDAAVALLSAFFKGLGDCRPAVVGSSMGGFYGQYLARRFTFSHLYLINPALTPWTLLGERIGEVMTTAEGEHYQVTRDRIDSTRPYGLDDPCDGIPTTLFLERGDTVIDSRIAEGLYAACPHARLLIWDGGDHAFQHMDAAIAVIRDHLDDDCPATSGPE